MSIIHATNNYDYENDKFSTGFSYILSGKTDLSDQVRSSVGVVLLHNKDDKQISIENALTQYCSFQSDSIIFAHSDGSLPSAHLQNLFPNVHFFSLKESEKVAATKSVSVGSLLNILFSEIKTDLIFVSWSHINPYGISTSMLSRHVGEESICLVPVLEDNDANIIPASYKVSILARKLKITINEKVPLFPYTFLPHNFTGIFNRKQTLLLQGFDNNIKDPFWQLCDFAIRAYCANQHMRVSPYYRVRLSDAKKYHKKQKEQKKNRIYELLCIKHGLLGERFFIFKHKMKLCFESIFAKETTKKQIQQEKEILHNFIEYSKKHKETQIRTIYKKAARFFKNVGK